VIKILTSAQSSAFKVSGIPLPFVLVTERPLLSSQASYRYGAISGGTDSPPLFSSVVGVSLDVVVIFVSPNGDLQQVTCSASQGTPWTSASQKYSAVVNSSLGGFSVLEVQLLNTFVGTTVWERIKLSLGLLY